MFRNFWAIFVVLNHMRVASSSPPQAEWCKEHIIDIVSLKFMAEEWKCVLPFPTPKEEEAAVPPQPALSVLQWSQKAKQSGLPTLRTPDKIIRQWSISPSADQFMSFLGKMCKKFALDLPATEAKSVTLKDNSQSNGGNQQKKLKGAFLKPPKKCSRLCCLASSAMKLMSGWTPQQAIETLSPRAETPGTGQEEDKNKEVEKEDRQSDFKALRTIRSRKKKEGECRR